MPRNGNSSAAAAARHAAPAPMRVDVIEQPDRAADLAGACAPGAATSTGSVAPISRVGDEHQQRGSTDRHGGQSGQPDGERADLLRTPPTRTRPNAPVATSIAASSGKQRGPVPPLRHPAAREAAEPEAQHERGHHDRHRYRILTPKMRNSARCQVS